MPRLHRPVVTLLLAFGPAAFAPGGDWPQFRGPHRDNISRETGLLREWPAGGPRVLWSVEVCEGYAAAAIHSGRVYFNDYDREAGDWLVRCLDLADGRELWRFREAKRIRPNHGITRTVPAVDGRLVFAFDPKCVLHCLDAATGREVWQKNLVREYGTQIPPWNNGQCPLLEADRVILGIGGEALLAAFDKATGRELWRTPNPERWPMAHSSVMPATLGGVRQYLWCTLFGPVGVAADDGRLLWHHDRRFNVAIAPSPLAIGDDRVLMTAGYEAGTVMFRVTRTGERFTTETIFDWPPGVWNSEVHTPILYRDHLFAVGREKRGLFTCLDLDGRIVWTSEGRASFDLGSFLLADGMFFILDGQTGVLRLVEASTTGYRELASAPVLGGDNVWGPLALSNGRLVLRDMTRMVCLDVGAPAGSRSAGAAGGVLRLAPLVGYANCAPAPPAGDAPKPGYRREGVRGGRGTGPAEFDQALRGVALDAADRLYAVGDTKVAVFSPAGEFLRGWATERPGYSVAVAADGTVFIGAAGQVELFEPDGRPRTTWRDAERLGLVTAIAPTDDAVLLADAGGRCIRRYDRRGRFLSDVGEDARSRGLLLPNRHLDFARAGDGSLFVANPGRHRVERYAADGRQLGHFGRFDGRDPAAFTGCCNPTNLALTPAGDVVTAEKAPPRVKVLRPDGTLLAIVADDGFDPGGANMDVAVDSRGRVYVADPVRLEVVVFAPAAAGGPERAATAPAAQEVRP